MRLHVRHRTTYRFDAPMRWITQSHRLTPAGCAAQKIVDWKVLAEGAEFGATFVDGAGDRITTMTIAGPVDTVDVLVEGVVETVDTAGVLRDHREIISPRAYLVSTPLTKVSPALSALAEKALRKLGKDEGPLSCAHRLSGAVSDAIAYVAGATDSATTAAEALEKGEGVCQDHAHALVALAHSVEVPARFVAGYMLSEAAVGTKESSHAWAELFVPSLGWIGFDPANRCCPDDRYVRLGSGRDALEAAPIRGISRGAGQEALDVSVVVSQTQQ
jgi:transglutaminase-like putative cysteine protease